MVIKEKQKAAGTRLASRVALLLTSLCNNIIMIRTSGFQIIIEEGMKEKGKRKKEKEKGRSYWEGMRHPIGLSSDSLVIGANSAGPVWLPFPRRPRNKTSVRFSRGKRAACRVACVVRGPNMAETYHHAITPR